jgi:nucleoside-diphosphate-sugar epimerase
MASGPSWTSTARAGAPSWVAERMPVLVTGGCGLVGASLVHRLLAEPEAEVIVLDLSPPDELVLRLLGSSVERVTFIQADVSSAAGLEAALAAVDCAGVWAIVHAAILDHFPGWERDNTRAYVDVNLSGTINLLEVARRLPALRAFVYVGSGSVYGEPGPGTPLGLQGEDGPIDPPELYAITKYAAELVVRRYGTLFGLDVRRVRLSGVFGAMERPTAGRKLMSPVHAVARAFATGAPLRITARTLDSVGDHVSGEDVADGLARLVAAEHAAHPVYNLADGRLTTFRELLGVVEESGVSVTVEIVDDPGAADLDLDPANRLARWNAYDVSRAREDLGWSPRPLSQQLASYFAWLR